MSNDLFSDQTPTRVEELCAGACVLRHFALARENRILAEIASVIAAAPLRHMQTPGGYRMSVAMTNCGDLGWITDRAGYRYAPRDPLTGQPWPPIPDILATLAHEAAQAAGFAGFEPDACLINRYEAGARMSLHQDRDERDFGWPIVSVSLGLPATFLFGGMARTDRAQRVPLTHGDVIVWGGTARLRFHGVQPVKPGSHALTGEARINLTFRRAG